MTTDAPLTDAERALLIEGYRQNIPDVVAACEWILLARVTALRETIAQEIREREAKAWQECVQAVAWCIDQDEGIEAAITYVSKNNPYRGKA
jgi:hypothetical protein